LKIRNLDHLKEEKYTKTPWIVENMPVWTCGNEKIKYDYSSIMFRSDGSLKYKKSEDHDVNFIRKYFRYSIEITYFITKISSSLFTGV
jgi:hypothetical protein